MNTRPSKPGSHPWSFEFFVVDVLGGVVDFGGAVVLAGVVVLAIVGLGAVFAVVLREAVESATLASSSSRLSALARLSPVNDSAAERYQNFARDLPSAINSASIPFVVSAQ